MSEIIPRYVTALEGKKLSNTMTKGGITMTNNQLQVFNFGMNEVRTVMKDNEAWFVAKDVCDVLEITDSVVALRRIDEDEKCLIPTPHPQSNTKMMNVLAVNEYGLYTLVLGSRKPEAKQFKRWITHEVIPAIRKTGSYSMPTTSNSELILMIAQQNLEMEKRQHQQEQKLLEVTTFISEKVTDIKRYRKR
jgi:anti-repressor protein